MHKPTNSNTFSTFPIFFVNWQQDLYVSSCKVFSDQVLTELCNYKL